MKPSKTAKKPAIDSFLDGDEDEDDESGKPNYFESSMSMPIDEWRKKQQQQNEKSSVDIPELNGNLISRKI